MWSKYATNAVFSGTGRNAFAEHPVGECHDILRVVVVDLRVQRHVHQPKGESGGDTACLRWPVWLLSASTEFRQEFSSTDRGSPPQNCPEPSCPKSSSRAFATVPRQNHAGRSCRRNAQYLARVRMVCIAWPNSWKSVSTSSCDSSDG